MSEPGVERRLTTILAADVVGYSSLLCRIDTADELAYFNNGGILHDVLRDILKAA